jgi:hypothetical protein
MAVVRETSDKNGILTLEVLNGEGDFSLVVAVATPRCSSCSRMLELASIAVASSGVVVMAINELPHPILDHAQGQDHRSVAGGALESAGVIADLRG